MSGYNTGGPVRSPSAVDVPAWPHAPALVYVTSDGGSRFQVDECDLGGLTERERAICRALLEHVLKRIEGTSS